MPLKTIGLDPGLSGGIALYAGEMGCESVAVKMPPTQSDILGQLIEYKQMGATYAMIEKVASSPQMGKASAFTFGQSFGALQMALTALGLPWEFVTPSRWQKAFGLISKGRKGRIAGGDESDTDKKNRNKARAQELSLIHISEPTRPY